MAGATEIAVYTAEVDQPESQQPTAIRIVSEVRWVAVGHLAAQIMSSATVVVLAGLLSPRAFGTVAAGMAIVGVATLIMQSGTGGAIIASAKVSWSQARNAALANFGVGAALTLLIAVVAGPLAASIARGGDSGVLRVLSLSVTIVALSVVPTALVRKAMRFKRLAAVTSLAAVLSSVVAIVAVILGAGVWALVVRNVLFQVLIVVFIWIAARDLLRDLRRSRGSEPTRLPRRRRLSFLIIASSSFLALSIDNVVVGAATSATELGYYALAFTLAFAPLTQLSWQLGSVLFPAAAATTDMETLGRRTVSVIRVLATMLYPIVPPAIVLAPVIIPAVLGPQWRPMVAPFQILVFVGVAHATHNVIGESLSGAGSVGFRARCESAWALSTVSAVVVLVNVAGIRGAAIGHLVMFVPLAGAYSVWGMRRIGGSASSLWGGVRDIVAAVTLQGILTVIVVIALDRAGVASALSATAGAAAGLAVAAGALRLAPSRPFDDIRAVVGMALSRVAPSPSPG